jgi:hypothetical protein
MIGLRQSGSMKYRIAVWSIMGFVVAGCWALYAFARPFPITAADPIVENLAGLTQPIVLAGFHFHFGLHFYWVVLANAATYGLIGVIVETLRFQFTRAR